MAIDVFCRFLSDILLLTKAPVFVWFDGTIIVHYYYPLNYVLHRVSFVLLCCSTNGEGGDTTCMAINTSVPSGLGGNLHTC